jgi:hypothetical protein
VSTPLLPTSRADETNFDGDWGQPAAYARVELALASA